MTIFLMLECNNGKYFLLLVVIPQNLFIVIANLFTVIPQNLFIVIALN